MLSASQRPKAGFNVVNDKLEINNVTLKYTSPETWNSKRVIIVGGGLAGCEAAWQLLTRGKDVTLYEMKPAIFSPAHTSPHLAELVCSNSLRSNMPHSAVGLLKEEMRRLGSLIIAAADATSVPAGKALAVDRDLFSRYIEEKLSWCDSFTVVREELTEIPEDSIVIIATGPLTSDRLAAKLSDITGSEYLYFYDAISPIVEAETIDHTKVFRASRYDDGEGDYLNAPMTKEEYARFYRELSAGEEVPLRNFEDSKCFDGCLPVEVLARRGEKTLLFGPMKPVGLVDPSMGTRPFAVVQFRQENKEGSLYNMVGFQTKLTWPEQKRIFRLIPGLEQAEFARYGSIHRNTFINSPALLTDTLQLQSRNSVFIAGQLSGVEGYVESAAMGLIAGLNAARYIDEHVISPPHETTALGALVHHITNADRKTFQPMNINFGLFPPATKKVPKKQRGLFYSERSLADLDSWARTLR